MGSSGNFLRWFSIKQKCKNRKWDWVAKFNGLEFSLELHCFDWLADLFDMDTFILKGVGIEFAGMALCSSIQVEKYLYYVLVGFVFINLFKMCLSTCLFFFIIIIKYKYEMSLI